LPPAHTNAFWLEIEKHTPKNTPTYHMKKFILTVASILVAYAVSPGLAAPPENQVQALEIETVFALAHDELVDLQHDTKTSLTAKIASCERYISALTRFIKEYPKEFDTQDNLKDLNKFLSDAKSYRDAWKANQ
jgi:hypothetical protein